MVSGEVGIFETVECLCANAQMRMFWVVSLQSHSFVPPLLLQKYSIVWFFFFVFLKASLPRPLSLSHFFLHCAPFSESTEVSSYFRGNKLSVSPFFSNWDVRAAFLLFSLSLPQSLSHTHSLTILCYSLFSPPFLNIYRRGGWCRISGCGCVRSEASSPTAEPDARGADQPPGTSEGFLSQACACSKRHIFMVIVFPVEAVNCIYCFRSIYLTLYTFHPLSKSVAFCIWYNSCFHVKQIQWFMQSAANLVQTNLPVFQCFPPVTNILS